MDVPDLVRQSLGDEEIKAGVALGDEDAVCFTPTRTLVYRGEGLLSDEDVSAYPHDFERLAVSEGRRKTKYSLTYVDRKEQFTVPGNRTDAVLERLVEGTLQANDVLEPTESVTGVFRFSELTLVVAQQRLLKHIGEYTWDADFEVYDFDDVTGLHFEDGSVATAVVLEADGRTERVKAPNDQAPLVRQTIERALFDYYDVGSLDELNAKIMVETDAETDDASADEHSGGLGLESDIDPLVSDSEETASATAADHDGDSTDEQASSTTASSVELGETDATDAGATPDATAPARTAASSDDMTAVTDQLADLTAVIERQNELLQQQQRTVKQLIEELCRGR